MVWKRFLSWKIILVPIGIFAVIFAVKAAGHAFDRYRYSKEVGNKTIFQYGELPACGDKKEFFTVSPVKDGLYSNIVPLGNFGATGGHVIPTKHIYFIAKDPDHQPLTDIYAPGDLHITTIEQWHNLTKNLTEYFVYTSPCQDIEVNFYHFNELSPKLMEAFNKKTSCDWQRSEQTGNTSYQHCGKVLHGVTVAAGEVLGKATPANKGGIRQFFDFEMSDHRTQALAFANPKRFEGGFDFKHIVCPLDYFTPALKQKFFSQIADYYNPNLKRTARPLCGEYMQDVPGTAQGVWFKNNSDTADNGENSAVTLAHHNVLTQKGIFSIGTQAMGTIEAGEYPFVPQLSGLINRDFKDVTADGKTYCFEPTGLTGTYNYPFRIILQMTSPTKLKIEGQKVQGCGSGPWNFDNGASEFER